MHTSSRWAAFAVAEPLPPLSLASAGKAPPPGGAPAEATTPEASNQSAAQKLRDAMLAGHKRKAGEEGGRRRAV